MFRSVTERVQYQKKFQEQTLRPSWLPKSMVEHPPQWRILSDSELAKLQKVAV